MDNLRVIAVWLEVGVILAIPSAWANRYSRVLREAMARDREQGL